MSSKLPQGFFDSGVTPKITASAPSRQSTKGSSESKLPAGFFDPNSSSGLSQKTKKPAGTPREPDVSRKEKAKANDPPSAKPGVSQVGLKSATAFPKQETAPASASKPSTPAGPTSSSASSSLATGKNAAASSKLPEGFFDDLAADSKARGVQVKKLDIKDELQEFEKSIKKDLEVAQQREDEEEAEAADEREELESLAQREMREKVARFRERLESQRKRQKTEEGTDSTLGKSATQVNGSKGDTRDEDGEDKEENHEEENDSSDTGDQEEEESEDEEDEEDEEELGGNVGLLGPSLDWRAKRV